MRLWVWFVGGLAFFLGYMGGVMYVSETRVSPLAPQLIEEPPQQFDLCDFLQAREPVLFDLLCR